MRITSWASSLTSHPGIPALAPLSSSSSSSSLLSSSPRGLPARHAWRPLGLVLALVPEDLCAGIAVVRLVVILTAALLAVPFLDVLLVVVLPHVLPNILSAPEIWILFALAFATPAATVLMLAVAASFADSLASGPMWCRS